MQWRTVAERWEECLGLLRKRWGQFSDDDWDFIRGHRERLCSRIQETECMTREEADAEIDAFLRTI